MVTVAGLIQGWHLSRSVSSADTQEGPGLEAQMCSSHLSTADPEGRWGCKYVIGLIGTRLIPCILISVGVSELLSQHEGGVVG